MVEKKFEEEIINFKINSKKAEINFKIIEKNDLQESSINVFTTRPDTIFGATFIAISPDHELSRKILEKDLGAKKQGALQDLI